MTDFQIRSDNVDVEQIMRQIRARIREKRGVDYTEEEIRELANVRLEKFLDPRGVRSDLIEQFRRKREAAERIATAIRALSLAQLNQPDVADTILMLLSRDELDRVEVFDRETDPQNPTFRNLNDQEKLRILINTMMGAKHLKVDAVQTKLADLTANDVPLAQTVGRRSVGERRSMRTSGRSAMDEAHQPKPPPPEPPLPKDARHAPAYFTSTPAE